MLQALTDNIGTTSIMTTNPDIIFNVRTTRNVSLAYQYVDAHGYAGGALYPFVQLYRFQNGTGWGSWYAFEVERIGKGAPTTQTAGFYGSKYLDINSGMSYIRKGSTSGVGYTWEPTNQPKEYWYASGTTPSTWTQSTSNTRITMAQTLNRGIPFSGNTFTLKGGKVYKVDMSFGVTTSATSGVIRIGIFNAATNSAADGNKIAVGTSANDKGNKSSTTSIIAPSVDTAYYVGIEANSPAGSFITYSQNITVTEI